MAEGRVTEIVEEDSVVRGLVIEVERRSREPNVRRTLVHLSEVGLKNVAVIG
jgi:hypothetical protein